MNLDEAINTAHFMNRDAHDSDCDKDIGQYHNDTAAILAAMQRAKANESDWNAGYLHGKVGDSREDHKSDHWKRGWQCGANEKELAEAHATIATQEAEIKDLTARLEAAERERDEAIAHDRQPYPTAHAYEQVCAALNSTKARLEAAEKVVEANASNSFTLEERRIVCLMEHDIHKYGEFQCDYNGWMRDLSERREAALSAHRAAKGGE